jgi:putative DNA primase/helicase
MKTNANAIAAWVRKYRQVTESSVALTFAEYQGERWSYNVDEGMWLQWVGTHWARKQSPEMIDALRHFMGVFANGFKQMQIITGNEAVKLQNQRGIAAVEKLCRNLPSFLARTPLYDADGFLLGTPGGTIDLRTGEMKTADPMDFITRLTSVTPAPPGTPLGPRFQAFMDEVMCGNRDLQRTMQQLAGICATGSTRDQRMAFLYGPGRNGKGVWCRTIAGVLGDYVATAPRDLFTLQSGSYASHPTALVRVVAARMVISPEIPEGAVWDITLIKEITGGDPMEIRRMRQDFYNAIPRCTVIVMGQVKPELKSVDASVRERFLAITFPVVIPEERRIPDLEKQFIAEEGPSILRWVIDGAVDRERMGRLHIAEVIRTDTEDYMAEENILADFIASRFERAPAGVAEDDKEWWVKTGDAYEAWKAFSGHFGRKPGAKNPFTTSVVAAGIGYHRANTGRYFTRVRMVLGFDLSQ